MRRTTVLSLAVLATAVLLSVCSGGASAQAVGSLPSGGTGACQTRSETSVAMSGSIRTAIRGRGLVAMFRGLPSNSWLAAWSAQSAAVRRRGFSF